VTRHYDFGAKEAEAIKHTVSAAMANEDEEYEHPCELDLGFYVQAAALAVGRKIIVHTFSLSGGKLKDRPVSYGGGDEVIHLMSVSIYPYKYWNLLLPL
jgi:hypothetical protein